MARSDKTSAPAEISDKHSCRWRHSHAHLWSCTPFPALPHHSSENSSQGYTESSLQRVHRDWKTTAIQSSRPLTESPQDCLNTTEAAFHGIPTNQFTWRQTPSLKSLRCFWLLAPCWIKYMAFASKGFVRIAHPNNGWSMGHKDIHSI